MGTLTDEIRRVVDEQKLAFIATVDAEGRPSLSPRGTIAVWDDDHLVFADICSPGTTANLQRSPFVEINVVDQTLRKGYRFSGKATVVSDGDLFQKIEAFYRARGSTSAKRNMILIKVERVRPLASPAHMTQSPDEVVAQWDRHWETLRASRRPAKH
ncbi:MAG: pyridoxamine 5'-phosphate oxidase family protein [Alphaproteobacteria bacterium]|nr:pyridoxamine 5'-phosphate oxidase family protein [Alphaproteobacteria bacterium]